MLRFNLTHSLFSTNVCTQQIFAEDSSVFLLKALKYGPPPHGGIAPGLDRLIMVMAGETSIKDVIAFPKNTAGISPMDESPAEVDKAQLDDLHLAVTGSESDDA